MTVARQILSPLRIDKLGLVDSPAQEGAIAVILKRRDGADLVAKAAALTTPHEGHTHLLAFGWTYGMHVTSGQTTFDAGHAHPFIVEEGGEVVIGEAQGHSHEVEAVAKARYEAIAKLKPKDDEDEDGYVSRFMADKAMSGEYPDAKQRAAVAHSMFRSKKTKKSRNSSHEGDDAMTVEEITKSKDAEIAKVAAERDAAIKRLERAERLALLSDAEKDVFKGLTGPESESFLICSSSERSGLVAKALAANGEVYKALDGTVYRKSDDPRTISLAKKLDEQGAELQKAKASREEEVIKARASAEMGHSPGKPAVKAAILRSLSGLPEADDVRKGAEEYVRAADAAFEFVMKSRGSRGGEGAEPGGGSGGAHGQLVALAKRRAEASGGKETFVKAYAEVLKTREGSELYAKAREDGSAYEVAA